ncbi:nucleoside-diphosphate sugar epimerase/dehydratase [Nostocoides sp. HKS02]|uniref:polysaccharide biosynthesis protein n=1 Tax=Nostocoides sp. HKS02 TaxID=1813880 RepID=UPI0012B4D7A0|nr:nucleoside-diphosphate sugar epimerase/dehydratase [Tetrasphaera sp. HKS02]QGN57945.1 SDR family NAD(P)-dependent oxidoreductase [Tetrasphaera sp. HKS02]
MWAVIDSAAWVLAVFLAAWLRYDLQVGQVLASATISFAVVAVICQVVFGTFFGPYAVGHQRGSFEETYDVGRTVLLTTLVLLTAVFAVHLGPLPRSIPFTAPAFAVLGMFSARFIIRSVRLTRVAHQVGEDRRAIIFGAGSAGRQLTRSLLGDGDGGYRPVALLDDDPTKARLRIDGIRVRGTRKAMAAVAHKQGADTLIIALPLAEAKTIRELTELAEDAGLRAVTLPSLRDIIGGRPTAGDLRKVDLADLLGRRPVELDMAVIAEQIAGKRILVTGAGGSIGSELCRQIARFGPAKLFLLDRDESGLQETQMSLVGNGLLDSDELILANIREVDAMRDAFDRARPDIVFHAAALKHLPLLESHPLEAWKTNVLGTLNVLQAASDVGVGTFVNISTDKAANPTCVLGYSKRVAERLTADFANRFPGRYVSVRFGNVLGSRGSVVHAFTAQIERGGPITVTHPEVERYFMLIPEACQLVLEAASIGTDGEVMVLEMGEQVKIVDVAETLIRMSGRRDIDIVYTGLRPGEKLGEELFSHHEQRQNTSHPLVSNVSVPGISSDLVSDTVLTSHDAAASWMRTEAATDTASARSSR